MAGENTVSTLNGLFKVVYADKLLDLVPDYAILQRLVDFVPADKETGNYYAQPVNLAQEGGFTYNGENGGIITLKQQRAGTMKEAQVKGSELILRAQMSYKALSQASTKGEKAFKRASAWKIEDMNNATRKRLEVAMLYGRFGIGTVNVATDLTANSATLSITAGTWAGGIWAGTEGHTLEGFNGTVKRTDGPLVISKVNSDLITLTVSYVGATLQTAAGDVLYFEGANSGASAFLEMAGIAAIINNASVLFNIDASIYSLWKGNTVLTVGQISFGKIQDAVAKAVNKGLMSRCVVLLSPKAWGVLNSDQAALRRYSASYKPSKFENGVEALTFYAANGELEIRSHPMVKDGDAFIIPIEECMRIGSIDLTFGVPGMDQEFFVLVPGTNAVEIQCMTDQAFFIEKPAHAVLMQGITYA